MESWFGTIITILILLCGTYLPNKSYELEAVISSPAYRIAMISIIIIAKFVNNILSIFLAVVLVTFVKVYSEYFTKTININRQGLSEEEYKQYMAEFKL